MIYVVGIDGSEQSEKALAWAVDDARRTGAVVEAVHAWQLATDVTALGQVPFDVEKVEVAGRALLDEVVDRVGEDGLVEPVRRVVTSGNPAPVVQERAAEADLLVVGTRGRGGFLSLLLGSVAEDCVHRAPCPLVLVPPDPPSATGTVVVGVDGSAESFAALRWAEQRQPEGAPPVVALYALNWHDHPAPTGNEPGFTDDDARTWLHGLFTEHGIGPASVSVEIVRDVPSRTLVERSAAGDLVVVGSRGAGRAKSLIAGSLARQLSHHATSPVVIHHDHDTTE